MEVENNLPTEDLSNLQSTEADNSQVEQPVEISIREALNNKIGINFEFDDWEESEEAIIDNLVRYSQEYHKYQDNARKELVKQTNPLLYQLEDLASQGGDLYSVLEQLIENKKGIGEFAEDNIDLHRNIVAQELKQIGLLSDEEITAKLAKMEDEGKLTSTAKSLFDKRQSEFQQKNEQAIKNEQLRIQQFNEIVNKNLSTIETTINNGKLGDLIEIPIAERPKFLEFMSSVGLEADENGKIYTKQYLDNESDLQSLFFKYRKGNLNDFIKAKASTQSIQSLLKKGVTKQETPKTKQEELDAQVQAYIERTRGQIKNY